MFSKLLKHEWKATWRVLGALSIGALLAGALGCGILRLLGSLENTNTELENAISVVLGLLLVLLAMSIAVYAIGSCIVLYVRFYRNKFTDEGYLTFTLPVRPWQIFLSSLLNISIWTVLILAVSAASCFLLFFLGMPETWDAVAEAYSELGVYEQLVLDQELQKQIPALLGYLLLEVLSFLAGNALALTCITLGSCWAKRHKLLAAVGINYGVSMIQGILSSVALAVVFTSAASMDDWSNYMLYSNLCETGIQILLGVGGFFLSTHLMKQKLRLP